MHDANDNRSLYDLVSPSGRVPADEGREIAQRPRVITQEELRTYHELRAQRARLDDEIETKRADLVGRIAANAPIERGTYDAELRIYEQKVFTRERLAEILGEDELEDLRDRITPTRRVNLRVSSR